jgi:hypothetical protein
VKSRPVQTYADDPPVFDNLEVDHLQDKSRTVIAARRSDGQGEVLGHEPRVGVDLPIVESPVAR